MKQARLKDGRVLAFAEWGEPQGRPVLFFHGTPGGRLTQWWDDRLPGDRGVRLVTVDRPGIGGSDAARGRSVADWVQDVGQLADHLGLDRLAVVGFSSGGAYALACAVGLPSRVTALGLVSPVGHADEPDVVSEMATARYQRLARRAPWAMALLYAIVARRGRRNPGAAHDQFFRGSARVDRAVVDRPEVRARWMAAFVDAAGRDGRGLADDMRVLQQPWGFDPAAISAPVLLWHGRQDRIVPAAHAERWAEELSGCRAVFYDDEGHFLIQDHMKEILEAVLTATPAG